MIADFQAGGMCQAGRTPAGPTGCLATAIVLAVCLPILACILPSCFRIDAKYVGIDLLNAEARKLGGRAHTLGHASDIFLDLAGTNVGDNDFAHLTLMEDFKWIDILSLADTRITDTSVERLVDHPLLSTLDLSRTKVTDHCLKVLLTTHTFTVRLSGTAITDAGLETIKDLPKVNSFRLGSIDLTDTKTSDEGIRKLAKAWKGARTNIIYGSSKAPQQLRP